MKTVQVWGFMGERGQHGFTLVELMVTVAVIAIIGAIAMPRFMAFVNANRLSGAAGEMRAALQIARSEAMRRNASVTVCGTNDGTSCVVGNSWARWIVSGPDSVTGAVEVIRDETVPARLQVSGPAAGIRFRPSGLIDAQSALVICTPTTEPAQNQRVLTVMVSGNIHTDQADGGGVCP